MLRSIACSALLLSACSLLVAKPPPSYRAGIAPDCDGSYLAPAVDYTVAAASLASIALDDEIFCASCPTPYIAAAVLTAIGVFGHLRVRDCRQLEAEHDDFLAQPREEQDRRIDERQSLERQNVGAE